MAITPNVPVEQTIKAQIRGNTAAGANSRTANPLSVINATASGASTPYAFYQLVWSGTSNSTASTTRAFSISGANVVVTGNGASNVNALISGFATAFNAISTSGYSVTFFNKGGDVLNGTTTDILLSTSTSTPLPTLNTYSGAGASLSTTQSPDFQLNLLTTNTIGTATIASGIGGQNTLTGYTGTSGTTTILFSGSATLAFGTGAESTPKFYAGQVINVYSGTGATVTTNNNTATGSGFYGQYTVITGTATSLIASLPYASQSGLGLSGASNVFVVGLRQETAYPNYFTSPNATPTWVDDATVHAYQITGNGTVTVNSGLVEQKQVRQLQTNFGETQIYTGYYQVYSGSLNQTGQRNTKQQQC